MSSSALDRFLAKRKSKQQQQPSTQKKSRKRVPQYTESDEEEEEMTTEEWTTLDDFQKQVFSKDDNNDETMQQEEQQEDLMIDFDVCLPNPEKDYHGVELYVKNLLHGNAFQYNDLVECILSQNREVAMEEPNPITSLIKVIYSDNEQQEEEMKDEEENWDWNLDCYGVVSCVDMTSNKQLEFVKQVKQYVVNHCEEVKLKSELKELLSHDKLALLINERVVNLPLQMIPPLHSTLFDEIQEQIKQDKMNLFKYYLIITKAYYVKANHKSKKQQKVEQPHFIFVKEEEEIYYSHAKYKYHIPLKNEYTDNSAFVDMIREEDIMYEGIVMLVERDKVSKIVQKIKEKYVQ